MPADSPFRSAAGLPSTGRAPSPGGRPGQNPPARAQQRGFDRRQKAHAPEVEEMEEWVISYMDMVTLLMIVFLGMLAIMNMKSETKASDPNGSENPVTGPPSILPPSIPALSRLPPAPRTRLTDTVPQPAPSGSRVPSRPGPAPAVPDRQQPVEKSAEESPAAEILPLAPPLPAPAESAAPPLSAAARHWLEQLEAAGLPLDVGFTVDNRRVAILLRERILFRSGAVMLEQGGLTVLKSLAPVLAGMPGRITVEGHSDNVAINTIRFPSNWELSSARASAVVRQLIELNLPPERLRAAGYADSRPLSRNEADRAQNRRVEIVIEDFDAP
jgi:chemotaxis protein MotB